MGRYFAVFVAAALLGSSPATEAAPKTPGQMKRAEQAERALKLLGYHQVYVFEWQGGVPGGWVQFDGPKAERWELPTLELARKQFTADEVVDPAQLSGMLVIAIRPSGKDVEPSPRCAIGIEVHRKKPGGEFKGTKAQREGGVRVFEFAELGQDDKSASVHIRSKDEKESRLFEVRLLDGDQVQQKGTGSK